MNSRSTDERASGRRYVLLDAPSNLGLRPPSPGRVPGCWRLASALRAAGLREGIGADDAGTVAPPAYDATWSPGSGVRNGAAIARYSVQLADRIGSIVADGGFPVVLGGDCSILLGSMLALRRRGRHGLAFLDAHSDFRHLGNAPHVGAAAGEDLALVTGRGAPALVDIEGRRPYVADRDAHLVGIREEDDCLGEVRRTLGGVLTSQRCRALGPARSAEAARASIMRDDRAPFWIHIDADVLDAAIMPAVDTPEPNGLDLSTFVEIVGALASLPMAKGLQVTVFDPELDPDGGLASRLADALVGALAVRSG
ncbi:MAG: arginase family protein [Thermoplasmata archaeon]|nr:arginase family protein [Thermoplasmata archaeon]